MNPRWLVPGLFFATLSTLLLETLDARLLSVLTWYHLSFFAVSLAMLGMAAGAVFVFLHPARFSAEHAPQRLASMTLALACAIPASHLMTLVVPFLQLTELAPMEVIAVAVSTVILAVPFVIAGVVVTLALTRSGGAIGPLYAADLAGAAAGCLLVVPMLERTNVSSAIFLAGAAAAVAAACFSAGAGRPRTARAVGIAIVLAAVAAANTGRFEWLEIIYPKNRQLWLTNDLNTTTRWNSHSYVLVQRPEPSQAFMWGPGKGADAFHTNIAWLAIDGEAGTPITEWNGDRHALDWVSYDVTALPYSLRKHGDVAVVGVGGGRDILAAIWGRSRSITGVDVNQIMIDLLEGSHRAFANIANQPEVALVHDDGRAFLTRTDKRFDVIQMSLVDTWAATGAGAFSLSENGLYTLDGWRIFLNRLNPGGILSVSRWFDPSNTSETSRLLALGTAALIDRGAAQPKAQLLLVIRDRVATLMVSTTPFTEADRTALETVSNERDFHVAVSPWTLSAGSPLLDRIASSTTPSGLASAVSDPLFDYTPPTDARPFYFNMLKPRAILHLDQLPRGGALGGNLRATYMLLVLLGVATSLAAAIIIWPLARAGIPDMHGGPFASTMAYFGAIGFAYMLIQIGLLQRFSVYIGHPTYTLAIVLFSMLLFTGVGSALSSRLAVDRTSSLFRWIPVAIALALAVIALVMPPVLASTIPAGLVVRTLIVLLFAAPLSVLLGLCFPVGVRLSPEALVAWAWGVNGASGVVASIVAVAISLWVAIDANFWIAAALYAMLAVPLRAMARAAVTRSDGLKV